MQYLQIDKGPIELHIMVEFCGLIRAVSFTNSRVFYEKAI